MTKDEASQLVKDEQEIIQVFMPDGDGPVSIMDVKPRIIHHLADLVYQTHRLYVVLEGNDRDERVRQLRDTVQGWHKNN